MTRQFGAVRRPNPVFSDEYQVLRTLIVAERRKAGISQSELAARLGKAKSHIALIERGQRRVDTLEFYLIARCLGVDPADAFSRVAAELDALTRERGWADTGSSQTNMAPAPQG